MGSVDELTGRELDAAVASIITEHTKPGTRRFSFSKYEGDK